MNTEELFKTVVKEHQSVLRLMSESAEITNGLKLAARLIVAAFRSGNKLLLCGNGGSAADAQHMAAELVGRFYLERKALDAEALTVNTSSLTAIGNDYAFDYVFARQVEAKGKRGDVLIGISTSGTSKSVIAALETAKMSGMKTICLTGNSAPRSLDDACDVVIRVPSSRTPRIQEMHILVAHFLCEHVEKEVCGDVRS